MKLEGNYDKNVIQYVGPESDKLAPVNTLEPHPNNDVIRRCRVGSVLDERENLKNSIIKEGLQESIKTFKNSKFIVGGNTRYETLIDLGVTEIPVQELPRTPELLRWYGEEEEIDPRHPDVLSKLRADNTRVTVPPIDRYLQAQEGIVMETKYEGELTVARQKEIMTESNIAHKTFKMLQDLEQGYMHSKSKTWVDERDDLFQELLDYNEGKDVAGQHKAQLFDHMEKIDPAKRTYPQDENIDQLLNSINWSDLTDKVKEEIDYQNQRTWFSHCNEKNFKGAMVHHIIADIFPRIWNELDTDIEAVPVDNQSRYDIHFLKEGEIVNTLEIKTTMNTTWSTVSKKYGYILLYKFSAEINRAAIFTSWLDKHWTNSKDKELWKAAGAGAVLDAKDLHEYGKFETRMGDMYTENGVLKVSTQVI